MSKIDPAHRYARHRSWGSPHFILLLTLGLANAQTMTATKTNIPLYPFPTAQAISAQPSLVTICVSPQREIRSGSNFQWCRLS